MDYSETHLLEINLISAQNLKLHRSLLTYALAWVDPNHKLRTLTRPGPNPTWNEKFLFRVNNEFLLNETSSVSVSVFSTGMFSDQLLGTVRFLLGKVTQTPSFSAVQIRRPSGRFYGVLNVAVNIANGVDNAVVREMPAICLRDLSAESERRRKKKGPESDFENSDGNESTTSDNSSKENREFGVESSGGLLCCLGMGRKGSFGPSERILRALMKENSE